MWRGQSRSAERIAARRMHRSSPSSPLCSAKPSAESQLLSMLTVVALLQLQFIDSPPRTHLSTPQTMPLQEQLFLQASPIQEL